MSRHPTAGRIDRSRPLRFTFDGRELTGFAGDTLASALLANDVSTVARSVVLDRARGIFAAGVEEPNAVVQLTTPFPEPMLTATTVELFDGLAATSLSGRGRLAQDGDPARYDATYAHCDVLVVGGGPAGLAAAGAAARSGGRVLLIELRPDLGGSDVDAGGPVPEPPAGVSVLTRTTVVGYYDDNYLLAVQRRTNHLGFNAPPQLARERVWRIRAGRVVLATGAIERPLPFADNDRPGVMLAGAARAYLHRYGVLVGQRAVVYTTNDHAYAAAVDLAAAGMEIVAIVDPRPSAPEVHNGIPVLARGRVIGTDADPGAAAVAAVDVEGPGPIVARFAVDTVLVSGGWTPTLHLYSQAGGALHLDPGIGAFVPSGCRQRVEVVGWAAGAGVPAAATVEAPDGVGPVFVDLQRDVTVEGVRRATGAGLRSVEHIKRFTTAGTAHDQGKTSGLLISAAAATALGAGLGDVGVTTFRPPYTPVSFAALAGRERGDLFDPVRVTPMHDWHCANGAKFENVGQWHRAWYYPRDGEDMAAAVARECRSAREHVAMLDASTLGKIEVSGPDAAEFLDRLYTNVMSSLAVGRCRYGVMCDLTGMVLDDGTVARLGPERFLVTTTTGNAARILDWMEEWLQTEWPSLRVWCTSVTEQWATVALVGPAARSILAGFAPDAAALPFLGWTDAEVAGLPARVFRISFSGELAYEVNVAWWHGLALWEAFAAQGVPPYGTETMHVLRAEKGYPIIGQDTDGTVTPHDLGLGWAVRKSTGDFIGRRSFARADTARPDRKHLVGLLPADTALLLPEGAHLVTAAELPAPPVPYLGHVTSSYRSEALGRTFALALIAGGRDRIGQRLFATVDSGGPPVAVTVTDPVLYDAANQRRDGVPQDPTPALVRATPAPRSPVAEWAPRFAAVGQRGGGRLWLSELPGLTQHNVRAAAAPDLPGAAVLRLGPDEWLVVGAPAGPLALAADAVVDLSAARTTLVLGGPAAPDVLAHGCALDLHPSVFGVGGCAQTVLGQAPVVLWLAAPAEFRILVRPSYAPYLAQWLLDAACEYLD